MYTKRNSTGNSIVSTTAIGKDSTVGRPMPIIEINVPSADSDEIHHRKKQQNDVVVQEDKSLLLTILTNQSKIISRLTKIQSTVNNLRFTGTSANQTSVPLFRTMQPAKNVQELDELEVNLGNEEYYAQVISEMKVICGSSGVSRGLESCYKLIDYFITRECFMFCSWAGSSKTDVQKVPFKMYKNFRKCFLTLVRETDTTFTEQDCDGFFKNILKNSRKRLESKGQRASVPRRRLKKSDWLLKKELIQHVTGNYNESGAHVLEFLEDEHFEDTDALDGENNEENDETTTVDETAE